MVRSSVLTEKEIKLTLFTLYSRLFEELRGKIPIQDYTQFVELTKESYFLDKEEKKEIFALHFVIVSKSEKDVIDFEENLISYCKSLGWKFNKTKNGI